MREAPKCLMGNAPPRARLGGANSFHGGWQSEYYNIYLRRGQEGVHYIYANLVCAEREEFQDTRRFSESGVVV